MVACTSWRLSYACRRSRYFNGVVIFLACLQSSPKGYTGQVILNKNPHLWMDTK
jgi:hypothetical protein